jgi:hypothetical protein
LLAPGRVVFDPIGRISDHQLRLPARQQCDKTEHATERLGYVLRALELEADASALENEQGATQGKPAEQLQQIPPKDLD